MSSVLPATVRICEVGPRDGLQNEARVLPTPVKLELVEALAATGVAEIEVTSFVRPERIPALADAEDLAAGLRDRPWRIAEMGAGAPGAVALSALVPNPRGYERFADSGLDLAVVFLSATESHNRANLNTGLAEARANACGVLDRARTEGRATRASISTAFGCPYEGSVSESRVIELLEELLAAGADRVHLSDTLGVAEPIQVRRLSERALAVGGVERIALHLHDTYGAALANVLAGWQAGVAVFDGAIGGTGGCPYAPGAAGNLATEDLVHLFGRMGVESGVDLDALVAAGRFLENALGRTLPGRALRALSAKTASEILP
ncbi:MAG TPA: hydroxymethylglutaryl-CoA lyase [Planctomycetota bacterium]